jgi:hypothetical protein
MSQKLLLRKPFGGGKQIGLALLHELQQMA